MDIQVEFRRICDQIEKVDIANDYSDCTVLEPYFQKLITIGENCSNPKEFTQCLIDIVQGNSKVTSYLLPYLMRHFKYSEVINASTIRLGEPPDPRYMNFHSDLVHAVFDKDWENSVLWKNME